MSNFRQITLGAVVPLSTTSNGLTSYTFANTTDQVEWVFQVPDPADGTRTVTITKLGYRLTSVTGTSPVMKISLQGIDGQGNPDGTIKGGGSPASQTFTPAGTNTWNWLTLANSYTANVGDWLSIVIAYNSGTLNGSNTPVFGVTLGVGAAGVPYENQNVAGVRTRSAALPLYGFQSATKSFGMPVQVVTATAFSTTSQRALRFMLDQSFVQSYKVAGARLNLTQPATGKVVAVSLYSGTTLLQTVTMPANVAGSIGNPRTTVVWFDSTNPLATLAGGQEYRLSVEPQDASNNVALVQFDFAAASDMDAVAGGQTWYLSTRASGGATAWSDTLTSRPLAELIISDWTTPPPAIVVSA